MSKKKGKNSPKKPIALIALVVVLIGTNVATIYYFTLFQPMVPLQDVPMSIGEFTDNPAAYIGNIVTISRYFVIAAGFPMLVENPLYFLNNSLKSDNHLLFIGDIPPDLEPLGRCSDVECAPEWEPGSSETIRIRYRAHTFRESEGLYPDIFDDSILEASVLDDIGYTNLPPIGQKYAVLYSGGMYPEKAYYRYWNDLRTMYYILQWKGYPAENIYVVYKDGVGEDANMPVDYAASRDNMDIVFQELNQTMTSRDSLFFFTTNHGGWGGISTWHAEGGGQYLNTTQVALWLDNVAYHHMIIVMEQCFSGKFIPALSAPNRVIMTACGPTESSYACDTEGPWDEFVYHFMSALLGIQLPAGIGDAFADFIVQDGQISMREAFLYAAIHDSWDETPLYDDDGDGVGLWAGPVFFGTGFYGDNIFL